MRAVIETGERLCMAVRAQALGGWLLRVMLALGGGNKWGLSWQVGCPGLLGEGAVREKSRGVGKSCNF